LVVGNSIFVINAEQNLIALEKVSGDVSWVKPLPRYENEEKRKDPIKWSGPIMANGKLILISTNGHIAVHNPMNGGLITRLNTKKKVTTTPIISNGTFYIVSQDGTLLAYR